MGTAYVSYVEMDPGVTSDRLRVRRLQDNDWVSLLPTGSGVVGEYDIFISPNGAATTMSPYIVYKDDTFLGSLTAKVYNGTGWSQIGVLSVATSSASFPHIVATSTGEVFVSYYDGQSSIPKVLEGNFGVAWSLVSSLTDYDQDTYPLELLLDSEDNMVSVFRSGSNVFAQQFESNTFKDRGNRMEITSTNSPESAAISPDDLLYLGFYNPLAYVSSLQLNEPKSLPWFETFDDLPEGTEFDTGATAWTSTLDFGTLEVMDSKLQLKSDNNGTSAVFITEELDISANTDISIEITVGDNGQNNKENNDFVRLFYVLDGGTEVNFGFLTDDIATQVISTAGLNGSTLQVGVEMKVSFGNESYNIDDLLIQGSTNEPVAVGGVEVNPETATLTVGGSGVQLTANVLPANATDQSVVWSSSNPSIASVDQNGLVTPLSEGTVSISATTNEGGFADASVVTVVLPTLGGLPWSETFDELTEGATSDGGATAWTTTVDQGSLEVTNNALQLIGDNNGTNAVFLTEQVDISGFSDISIEVTTGDLGQNNKESNDFIRFFYILDEGEEVDFGLLNDDITTQLISIDGLSGSTLQVGVEVQVSFGTETYFIDDILIQGSSNEPVAVSGVEVTPATATIEVGQTINLTALVLPANATNKNVIWSSSDLAVATVDQSGLVTGVEAAGNVEIIATTEEGGFVDSAIITVVPVSQTEFPWLETFDDLAEGSTSDEGSTAWTTSIDQGSLEVTNGKLELKSVQGGSLAFFESEVLDISTLSTANISLEVTDSNNGFKESNDYLKAYIIVDGGAPILIGEVFDDLTIPMVSFGYELPLGVYSTLQVVVEIKVSWNNETYILDNIRIDGVPAGPVGVTGVEVTPDMVTTVLGSGNINLAATVVPANATDKQVIWSSNNTDVATVDQNGTVSLVASGTAVITATTNDGGFADISTIMIEEPGGPIAPTSAPLPPVEAADNVLSIYSDTFVDVPRVGLNLYGLADFEEVNLNGDSVLRYSFVDTDGGNFSVIELGAANRLDLEAAGMTNFRFDVWFSHPVLSDTNSLFKLTSYDPPITEAQIAVDANSSPAIEQGRWLRFDFLLEELAQLGLTSPNGVQQFVIDLVNSNEVYMDNIYFYKNPNVGNLPWVEDFESDLSNGAFVDIGATAWSTTIDQGSLETNNGVLQLMAGQGGSLAEFRTEVIDINGYSDISISLLASDLDQGNKEPNDFLKAYYILDGGQPVLFGSVTDDIPPTEFSVSGLNGSTLVVLVEMQVSFNTEVYTIDNVQVDGVLSTSFLSARVAPEIVVKLSPNPVKSQLSIAISGEQEVNEIMVYDTSGRLVRRFDQKAIQSSPGQAEVNLIGVEQGIYSLSIVTQEGYLLTKRLIVR